MNNNDLRTEESLQPVKYLGKVHSLYSQGINVATESVRTVWKRSKKGSYYNRCAMSIHPFGLCIYEEIANGTYKSVWFDPIENISYCVAEPLHRRIFAWIARSQQTNELECHIVLCKTSKQSYLLAELLAKIFYQSYHHYRQQRLTQLTPNLSTRCSVCDTITRQQQQQQQMNKNLSLFRNHSHDIDDKEKNNDDYENISFQVPMIARVFVPNYENNSMNNSSNRSIDYDVTYIDEDLIKPVEYYQRSIV
ncbi:unnamed protein product [Adineta steineri]|uniref:PID domain-containing protein n=1 Tax=Adineta steineri TaxID=433720 RepID=A0A814ESF2_9BILA|nr:unnamed protein product [Adineta steineri]CAF0971359.1 unnamed protein product [Adineta steineri]